MHMHAGSLWRDFGIFAALMAVSAFFSGSETALTGVSRARMTELEANGDVRARLVNRLRERKEALISALLFGNSFVNIFASAFATAILTGIFGERGVVIATIGVTIAVLVFAEVMPKTYALMHADRVALLLARPVALFVAVCLPITNAVTKIVQWFFHLLRVDEGALSSEAQAQELRGAISLFKEAHEEEGGQHQTGAMLRSILDLADVTVEEIMVHRKNVRMLNADWPVQKIVDEVLHSAYTRLPVWRESPDNIVGVIHAKLLLNELRRCGGDVSRINIAGALMEPWFIPQSTTLFDQLQAFRRRREHFAIMVDEYGLFEGVITLEDILEEIVGQIDDEHDVAATGIHPQADGTYIVEGKVTIRDLNRDFDWRLPSENYSTVAGLLLFESQRIPSVGQTYTFHGFRFEILKKQRNQISSVRITPPADGAEEEAHAAGA
jgi:Mg2+/Co2+ transporter CorB